MEADIDATVLMEAEMGRGEAATSGDPLPDGLRPSH